jgi:hypothetical protein
MSTVVQLALSFEEAEQLRECEAAIEGGLQTFFQVGEALLAIRTGKLYRAEFKTFDEYCCVRWNMTDRRARQLMSAAEVMETLGKTGTIVPESESVVRPLATLKPEQQQQAWEKARESSPNGRPTAKHVQETVDEIKGKKPKESPASRPVIPLSEHDEDEAEQEALESTPPDPPQEKPAPTTNVHKAPPASRPAQKPVFITQPNQPAFPPEEGEVRDYGVFQTLYLDLIGFYHWIKNQGGIEGASQGWTEEERLDGADKLEAVDRFASDLQGWANYLRRGA